MQYAFQALRQRLKGFIKRIAQQQEEVYTMIKFIIVNTKTKEALIREIEPKQIKEFVRDGFDMFIPYQN